MSTHKTSSTQKHDAAEIKQLLQSQVLALVMHVAPQGYRSGRYWIARNPSRDDRKPGSFYVWLNGPACGGWRDEATGEKGDVFGLIGLTQGLSEFKDQLGWAKKFLNYERLPQAERARLVEAKTREREAEAKNEAALLDRNRGRAMSLWLKGSDIAGTKGARYLMNRGIDVTRLARPPRAVRFVQGHNHLESRQLFDCIVTRMDGPEGGLWAVHRTWIAHDGLAKAPVTPNRKIWPSFRGAAMRLARGQSGLPVLEAAKQGIADTLVLTEGLEDGLAVALACPEYRVWAAGSLGNLAHIQIPKCCPDVIVCADNDWGKPQAAKLLETAVDAIARQGVDVRVARSMLGKDVNDALRGAA